MPNEHEHQGIVLYSPSWWAKGTPAVPMLLIAHKPLVLVSHHGMLLHIPHRRLYVTFEHYIPSKDMCY